MKQNTWLNTVYSDGSVNYVSNPTPKKGEKISIKLRVRKNDDLIAVFLRSKEFGAEKLYKMEIEEEKNGFQYYSVEVETWEIVFHYHFYLQTEDQMYYYTQQEILDYIPRETTDFKLLVDYEVINWVKDGVFYQIFPDRFKNSRPEISVKDGELNKEGVDSVQIKDWSTKPNPEEHHIGMEFYGGDLYGIIDKLDYLKELGVTGLYLNPIFTAPSMHRYDALTYFKVDKHLGGDGALIKLRDELNKRDMKLILDISVNHISSDSEMFNKEAKYFPENVGAYNNPDSKERDYFFINEDGIYESWYGVSSMPCFNYSNEEVRNMIYRDKDSALKYWLQEPFNIDGWRFDVADVMARNKYVDVYHEVWKEISSELKSVKSEVYVMTEDWTDCTEMFDGTQWDATMNYFGFSRAVREFIGETDLYVSRHFGDLGHKLTAKQLKNKLKQVLAIRPDIMNRQMYNLIDSHDISRIYTHDAVTVDKYLGAIIMLFTFVGAPSIYYGDERLLDGYYGPDEGCRFPMDWSEVTDETEAKVFDYYKTLAKLRNESKAFAEGGYKSLYAEDYTFAYARFIEDENYITVISTDDKDDEIKIDLNSLEISKESKPELLLGNLSGLRIEDNNLYVKIPAEGTGLIKL